MVTLSSLNRLNSSDTHSPAYNNRHHAARTFAKAMLKQWFKT
jgi:hypothetical protein